MLSVLKKFVFSYFVLLSIFLFSIILVCLIPSSLLKNNIGASLVTLKAEGTYPTAGFPLRPIVLDNFTDPVMLNTAYSVDSKQPFRSALTNIRHAATQDEINQIINLEGLYNNQAKVTFGYERYWHGYLVFLRPMLVFSHRTCSRRLFFHWKIDAVFGSIFHRDYRINIFTVYL